MPTFRDVAFTLSAPVQPVTEAELRAAESALSCSFPADYCEFVRQFGAGEFEGLPLRVLSPAQLVEGTPEDRARLREFWFWTDSPEVWTQEAAVGSVACFDGTGGDDIRFDPSEAEALYILPHEESRVVRVAGFAGLVAFLREYYSGTPKDLAFSPWPRATA